MSTTSTTTRVISRRAIIGDTTDSDTEPTLPSPTLTYFSLVSNRTDGGPVPSWHQKIRRGDQATSFLFGSKRDLKLTFGSAAAYYTFGPVSDPSYQWTVLEGSFINSFVPNGISVDPTNATNMAKMKFVQRCLSELQSLESGVVLGELGQTLHMIKNPAKALRNGLDDYFDTLRRYRRGSASQKRRAIAETWLEYNFGWKPLISDIEGGMKALSRFSENPVRFKPVRASFEESVDVSPAPVVTNHGVFSSVTNRKHTAVISIRYQGVLNVSFGGREVSYSDLGLRFDQFVPTLWELIPYSFIVDYFSNVGDIITSWAFGSKNLRWYFKSSRIQSSYEHVSGTLIPSPGRDVKFTRFVPYKSHGTHVAVDRATSFDALVPSFRIEVPGMSSLKWLNLAALAQSRKSLRPF